MLTRLFRTLILLQSVCIIIRNLKDEVVIGEKAVECSRNLWKVTPMRASEVDKHFFRVCVNWTQATAHYRCSVLIICWLLLNSYHLGIMTRLLAAPNKPKSGYQAQHQLAVMRMTFLLSATSQYICICNILVLFY